MSCAEGLRKFLTVFGSVLAGASLLSGCHESPSPASGWGLTHFPPTAPGYEQVLDAVQQVISERYPMSAVSREVGFVVALTPVRMDGGSKTRKEISVLVRKNFTGAYDPVVRVRQFVEVGMPSLDSDPETANIGRAAPLARNEWQALDYLPYEEQALYDAILERISSPGAPADAPVSKAVPPEAPRLAGAQR